MFFTDSHCHLDFTELITSLSKMLQDCEQQNIAKIIVPSITPANWDKVLELTLKSDQNNSNVNLYACLGIHPWFLNDLNESHLALLGEKTKKNRKQIIAIGESGIDGVIAKEHSNLAKQQEFFIYQLQLAKQYQLPIIVHHRQSHHHILPLIRANLPAKGGVIHAFSGSYQEAKNYIDLGFKLGIGGTITYPRAIKTIKAIQKIPLSSLLLETDAPSMPLFGYQGQINTPLQLIKVFDCLAKLRHEDKADIATQIEENIQQLFFS